MRIVVLLCALALAPLAAFAGPLAESVKGTAQAGDAALVQGQRLEAPTAISTGPGSQVFLRFEDGMQIVLAENSLLRMVSYTFTSAGVTDRAVFDLLRGSARVVTGKLAANNPKQFFFRTPQAQLTVERPSDFTVALVNPAYITVNAGAVVASNTAGSVTLTAGSVSSIATNAAAATAIPASSLPPTAATSMSTLSVASVSAPVGGTSAGVGVAAAGTGGAAFVTPAVVLVGAAVAGAAAAVANSGDDPSTQSTATHH